MIDPLEVEMMSDFTRALRQALRDEEIQEPAYRTWKEDGITHVEVEDGGSQHVVWNIQGNRMIKTFDMQELPF